MFPPLPPEATLDRPDPVLADDAAQAQLWVPETIAALDWRRVVELARALAVFTGHEPGMTRLLEDGAAEFSMPDGRGGQLVVRVASWNRWMATAQCLESFAVSLRSARRCHGVYLAPGGFAPSAQLEAARHGIEAVDAKVLAERLNAIPAEHSEFFYDLSTAGSHDVPSCPCCMRKLSRVRESLKAQTDFSKLTDATYGNSGLVPEAVLARRVVVLKDCEVRFLREVRARDVVINGTVDGCFVCEGSLILNPGSVLSGQVAARSVLVRAGAQMLGETKILKGDLGSMEKETHAWLWRCQNVPSKPGCGAVEFLPH